MSRVGRMAGSVDSQRLRLALRQFADSPGPTSSSSAFILLVGTFDLLEIRPRYGL